MRQSLRLMLFRFAFQSHLIFFIKIALYASNKIEYLQRDTRSLVTAVHVYHCIHYVFSERELLYAVACPSVCRLSVCLSSVCLSVTLVHPTQSVEIFGHFVNAIWYPGHPLTSTENFTDIVGGVKRKRGSQIYCSDFIPIKGYISETVQDRR